MSDSNSGKKYKILITEDDYDNQKFLQLLLKKEFEVEICDSETSFYKHLNSSQFDLIIMDISLKGKKNGLDLTKELKNDGKYRNIPVICLTAHAYKNDKENAINAGVDLFLTKPIENQSLINSIKELLVINN